MRYVSLFSGIEAASVAWKPLGWEPVAFSEIEKFPCRVLQHHFPQVPNLGDITKIDWSHIETDVVIGGSPCQSFSVAGLRKGLDDPRGNLMLEYLRAIKDIKPTWCIWENVPGVLSADGGRAFATLLQGLEELGYGFAYRVLDAQFFGVAQRRRRVFVVGCLGSWQRAAAVLFESDSLRGNTKTSREKRAELTEAGGDSTAYAIAGNIIGREEHNGGNGIGINDDDIAPTLTSSDQHSVASFNYHVSEDARSLGYCVEQSPTITTGKPPAICMADDNGKSAIDKEMSGTLKTGGAPPIVMAPSFSKRPGQQIATRDDQLSYAITTGQPPSVVGGGNVRRLTPLECERLQGFSDGWTAIEGASDSARYKALGNSMAVPVIGWLGKRIMKVDLL